MTKTYFIAYIGYKDGNIVERGELGVVANISNSDDLDIVILRVKEDIKNKHGVDDVAITAFNEV